MANEKRLDLIDRNKLKSEFEWLKSVVNESSKYEIQEHIQRIEDAPAVDAVEVVRCKDCKNALDNPSITDKTKLACTKGVNWRTVNTDHFCSYGERRTDG